MVASLAPRERACMRELDRWARDLAPGLSRVGTSMDAVRAHLRGLLPMPDPGWRPRCS